MRRVLGSVWLAATEAFLKKKSHLADLPSGALSSSKTLWGCIPGACYPREEEFEILAEDAAGIAAGITALGAFPLAHLRCFSLAFPHWSDAWTIGDGEDRRARQQSRRMLESIPAVATLPSAIRHSLFTLRPPLSAALWGTSPSFAEASGGFTKCFHLAAASLVDPVLILSSLPWAAEGSYVRQSIPHAASSMLICALAHMLICSLAAPCLLLAANHPGLIFFPPPPSPIQSAQSPIPS